MGPIPISPLAALTLDNVATREYKVKDKLDS